MSKDKLNIIGNNHKALITLKLIHWKILALFKDFTSLYCHLYNRSENELGPSLENCD